MCAETQSGPDQAGFNACVTHFEYGGTEDEWCCIIPCRSSYFRPAPIDEQTLIVGMTLVSVTVKDRRKCEMMRDAFFMNTFLA